MNMSCNRFVLKQLVLLRLHKLVFENASGLSLFRRIERVILIFFKRISPV